MTISKIIRSLGILLLLTGGAQSQIPQILSLAEVGPEDTGVSGAISSIAIAQNGEPRIVTSHAPGSAYFFADRTPSGWQSTQFNSTQTIGGSPQFGAPVIEIDSQDTMWVSGLLWYPRMQAALVIRQNASDPSSRSNMSIGWHDIWTPPGAFEVGNLSIDIGRPGEAVHASHRGKWFRYNTAQQIIGQGTLNGAPGGEKAYFNISKADDVPHPNGPAQRVWYHVSEYGFQSSLRNASGKGWIEWAKNSAYPYTYSDHCYPIVKGDAENPQIAYMSIHNNPGVYVNIWEGSDYNGNGDLRFPSNNLLSIDPVGWTGRIRYEPQMAVAPKGGVWISWQRGSGVYLRFIPSTATSTADLGETVYVTEGLLGSMRTDSDGNIHMIYELGGNTMYRKLSVSGGSIQPATLASDFDGNGADDLGIYDPISGNWWAKAATPLGDGGFTKSGQNWGGWQAAVPVPGRYNDPDRTDPGVYDTQTGNWYTRSHTGDVTPENWGFPGVIPIPGDYVGDDRTDYAVYNPSTSTWYIKDSSNLAGPHIIEQWGAPGQSPVLGDFDGDGKDDWALYDSETFTWNIRTVAGDSIVEGRVHGFPGTQPVAGNLDADPADELGAYDRSTGTWYFINTDGTWVIGQPPAYLFWGFPGALPVVGNFDGDINKVDELGVYHPAAGNWYIRTLNNTTPANLGWPSSNIYPLGGNR